MKLANIKDAIDIGDKEILILEITQSNTASYSCRITQKKWEEYSLEDEESLIKIK